MQSLLTKDSTPDGDDGNSHHNGEPQSNQSQHPCFYNLLSGKWEDVSTAAAAFSIDLYIIFIMRSQVINYCVFNSLVIMMDCRRSQLEEP